jgi:hypothetical protein
MSMRKQRGKGHVPEDMKVLKEYSTEVKTVVGF